METLLDYISYIPSFVFTLKKKDKLKITKFIYLSYLFNYLFVL